MPECFACETQYEPDENWKDETYCSPECRDGFTIVLQDKMKESQAKGLVDADGNSILGGAYQQAVQRTIRAALEQATGKEIKDPLITIMKPKGE